jgi:hypothetical protein
MSDHTPQQLDEVREMVFLGRQLRKHAEGRRDQRGVDRAEEGLRTVRRLYIVARRMTISGSKCERW